HRGSTSAVRLGGYEPEGQHLAASYPWHYSKRFYDKPNRSCRRNPASPKQWPSKQHKNLIHNKRFLWRRRSENLDASRSTKGRTGLALRRYGQAGGQLYLEPKPCCRIGSKGSCSRFCQCIDQNDSDRRLQHLVRTPARCSDKLLQTHHLQRAHTEV